MHMRDDPKLATLRGVPALRGMRDKELARIATLVDEVELEPGTVLTREGQPAQECFVLLEGQAEVTLRGEVIATVGPGDFVGEMGVIDIRPRSATVRALTPIRALVADMRAFSELIREPQVARAVLTTMAERLRRIEGAPTDYSTA
jgi:CRP-like cAMP-binding protein